MNWEVKISEVEYLAASEACEAHSVLLQVQKTEPSIALCPLQRGP